MYPPEPDDDMLPSERKVFEALRDGLSDEWEAYHSVAWLARDHAKGAQDGEMDVVRSTPSVES